MKMPVLLSGHTMTPAVRLRPRSMQLNLRVDGLSSASIVLEKENPDVTIGSWIQIWAPNNEMCVMYVRNMKKDYFTGRVTLTLEHTFGLLQGMIVFGNVTPEMMAGSSGATTCTVYQAISYLLGRQTETLWAMAAGDCDFSDAQGWQFTNSDIYGDLNSLTDAIESCQWEFDQTTFPWKLKLKTWPVSPTMEMRRNRNLKSLTVTKDQSGMYTRVYPTGKSNIHINSVNSNVPYLDRNTGIYGVIAQVITDSTIKDPGLLKAWATKQLKRNSEPKYTVSITGYELSESTGETLDKFITGRLCRVPLPEYGVTVNERLTELSWKDCISQPEAVTCTLANELKTVTGILNEKARGGGGGSKKANMAHDSSIGSFENSDIWINKDSIWAVCGCYDVITTSSGKELRMKDGTALTITRNGSTWGIYDQGNLTGGIIINKINGDETHVTIQADFIDIDGIVEDLAAYSVSVAELNVNSSGGLGGIYCDTDIECDGDIACAGTVACDNLEIGSYDNIIVDASVSGNNLTLTRADGTNVNFSKATTLSGTWSSGTLTITASPQDSHLYVGLFDLRSQDIVWNNEKTSATVSVYANLNGGETRYDTGKRLTVPAPSLSWSYGSASSQSSAYSSYDKSYSMNSNYAYHRFGVTVNGVTKYIQIHILQN